MVKLFRVGTRKRSCRTGIPYSMLRYFTVVCCQPNAHVLVRSRARRACMHAGNLEEWTVST